MKAKLLLLSAVLFTISVQAAKFRVNNELVASGSLYTSFATAQTAASNGDTIYMEGTVPSYGSITVSKRLVIIGPGSDQGYNPKTLPSGKNAYATQITFVVGSANSVVMGMYTASMRIAEHNITIMRNYIVYNGSQNWAIQFPGDSTYLNPVVIQNLFYLHQDYHVFGLGGGNTAVANMIFQNNIVWHVNAGSGDLFERNHGFVTSTLIENNTLKISKFTALGIGTIVRNNIVQFTNAGNNPPFAHSLLNNFTNRPTWTNCVSCSTTVDMSSGFFQTTAISNDGLFLLVNATAAKTASTTFGEIGAFGGTTPYVLSGLPTVPSIYDIIMPGVGTSAGGLNVTIKAKRNP